MNPHRPLYSVLLALVAACSAPASETDAALPASVKQADVLRRAGLEGCELIPYIGKRAACIQQQTGLHNVDTCKAPTCEPDADAATNLQRKTAWQSCVKRRIGIDQQFASTVQELETFREQSPQYKRWSSPGRNARAELIGKIEAGRSGDEQALHEAEGALASCGKIVGVRRG
jgi:hypothetical protein